MKAVYIWLVLIVVINVLAFGGESRLKIEPQFPKRGETIKLTYDKSRGELKDVQNIAITAYMFGKDLLKAKDVKVSHQSGKIKAEILVDENVNGIVFKIYDGDELLDNNDGNGFFTLVYSKDNKPIAGAYAGLAEANSDWGEYFAGMKRDPILANTLFDKEFENYPESKIKYFNSYITIQMGIDRTKAQELALAQLEIIASKENISLEELTILQSWYSRFRKQDEAKKYGDRLAAEYPKGDYSQMLRAQAFNTEKDTIKKIELFEAFYNDFPESKLLGRMYDIMSDIYLSKGIESVKKFFEQYPRGETRRFYNKHALKFASDVENTDLAEKFALAAIKLAHSEIENPTETKPDYITDKEWAKGRETNLASAYDTYASILIKSGKDSEALNYLEKGVKLSESKNVEINSRYIKTLNSLKKDFYKIAEEFIKSGSANDEIKELFRTEYLKKNDNEDEFNSYLSMLEKPLKDKIKSKLLKELISEPAPDFTLLNLSGEEIQLSKLKGKTIVIDFWATWCNPCLVSFPGMQKAVTKLQDDTDIAFLFLNTWENVADKKTHVTQFIEKNKYSFHVLMDEQNEVVAKYKVEGIPTKFVIDKDGNIRFKSVGFSGNTEKMVEELLMMIEIVK